jgi:phosphopantothenoylcysteine decarboxylase/phosphopantothenate--cysteine ligase
VTLVAADMDVAAPDAVDVIRVESTADLQAALRRVMFDGPPVDALVMAAAVADFRPAGTAERKLERGAGLTLELEPTPDLLAEIATRVHDDAGRDVRRTVLVGFAAETGSLDRAADKLRRKRVDLLVANDVADPGSGFGTDTNRVSILAADGSRDDLPSLSKREVGDRILDRVAALLAAPVLDDRAADPQTLSR